MKKGFTLLELLLVLALIGLITGVIMPRLDGSLSGIKLRSAANKVVAMLRYARSRTAAEQLPYRVVFDRKRGRVLFEAVEDEEGSVGRGKRKSYQLPEEVEIADLHIPGESSGRNMAGFVFDPRGSCSGGEVVLTSGRQSFRIKLDRITGLVEVD